jgi:hypothetical protein
MSGGKARNVNSLANLKVITSDTAKENQKKSVQSRLANIQAREAFKLSAKNFKAVMDELPEMSSLDVIKMAMLQALQEDNLEDAARYASMLAEYQAPKLQRIEQNTTTRVSDMSDEELQRIISQEGLEDKS